MRKFAILTSLMIVASLLFCLFGCSGQNTNSTKERVESSTGSVSSKTSASSVKGGTNKSASPANNRGNNIALEEIDIAKAAGDAAGVGNSIVETRVLFGYKDNCGLVIDFSDISINEHHKDGNMHKYDGTVNFTDEAGQTWASEWHVEIYYDANTGEFDFPESDDFFSEPHLI